MMRNVVRVAVLATLIGGATMLCSSQTSAELNNYFQQYVGLSQDEITSIWRGKAVAKEMKSRIPDEIFVFGAVFVKAEPESYVKLAHDFKRLRSLPGYLAIQKFSDPPQLSDLKGFALDSKDIQDLKDCKPDHCNIQIAASTIDEVHQAVNWSAPDVDQQVNQLAQKKVLQLLQAYQEGGNKVLGSYNDKHDPAQVPQQFKYMLSYTKALPKVLPDFYKYLLDYPNDKPANAENMFYWANLKFGLKPTLRVVQVITMKGSNPQEPAYTIAEKQLYASHYFETALDLTYCVSSDDPKQPGFYLITVKGSEQAGLTGFKGGLVRGKAVGRSVSSLEKSLTAIKQALEQTQSSAQPMKQE